jgi:hypothetical protein
MQHERRSAMERVGCGTGLLCNLKTGVTGALLETVCDASFF